MGKLFGTDGIRGVANEYPLTPEMAMTIGRAVVAIFKSNNNLSKIVIGKDTRLSGFMIEHALASGICSMGGEVHLAGTLPTPGVAYLASSTDANAGIVISASHNPFYDNGIKIFNGDGFKLSDELEEKIEKTALDDQTIALSKSVRETGRVRRLDDASQRYKEFLKRALSEENPFKGMKIVLDCSNGATCRVAPQLFDELGAKVESISVHPDGKNINANCGSEHPDKLAQEVIVRKADIGLAFDGDGDRLIAVDEKGQIVTGDRILAICAKVLKQEGRLKNNLVVSTLMSNLGLRIALKDMGINHVMTNVGDRYVLEEMLASGAVIGGEDSGHMIFLDKHTTGDGVLTGIKLIEAMQKECKTLSELREIITVFPQVLVSVNVQRKPDIQTVPKIVDVVHSVEKILGQEGRVLVRYSGTQPLCRVMVEGPSEGETQKYCQQIAGVIQSELGK
jgi:phosphoglucosamine mutase